MLCVLGVRAQVGKTLPGGGHREAWHPMVGYQVNVLEKFSVSQCEGSLRKKNPGPRNLQYVFEIL